MTLWQWLGMIGIAYVLLVLATNGEALRWTLLALLSPVIGVMRLGGRRRPSPEPAPRAMPPTCPRCQWAGVKRHYCGACGLCLVDPGTADVWLRWQAKLVEGRTLLAAAREPKRDRGAGNPRPDPDGWDAPPPAPPKPRAQPWACEHPNEVPHACPCPPECYCRVEGSCRPPGLRHTCGRDGDPGAVAPLDGRCGACETEAKP